MENPVPRLTLVAGQKGVSVNALMLDIYSIIISRTTAATTATTATTTAATTDATTTATSLSSSQHSRSSINNIDSSSILHLVLFALTLSDPVAYFDTLYALATHIYFSSTSSFPPLVLFDGLLQFYLDIYTLHPHILKSMQGTNNNIKNFNFNSFTTAKNSSPPPSCFIKLTPSQLQLLTERATSLTSTNQHEHPNFTKLIRLNAFMLVSIPHNPLHCATLPVVK